ncbi:hypothetical protein Hanom_Chr17g01560921 [Helianthus anomalus]
MFVHLTNRTKFLVPIRSFIKQTNINELSDRRFTNRSRNVGFVWSLTCLFCILKNSKVYERTMSEKKQLVLVVEGTVDLGSHWRTIVSDYLGFQISILLYYFHIDVLRMHPKVSQLRLFKDIAFLLLQVIHVHFLQFIGHQINKREMQSVSHLSDAETVARSFPQSCVSLSVICPKQLPMLKAIYNAVILFLPLLNIVVGMLILYIKWLVKSCFL